MLAWSYLTVHGFWPTIIQKAKASANRPQLFVILLLHRPHYGARWRHVQLLQLFNVVVQVDRLLYMEL
ncbi:hypothetical protein E2C01_049676 [Portunus trituberculatus]|uniref:Uncharacterized protein n=1 Tax=Portunus trituberculatus TaxID=210409 RepID=A0A5B7GA40_PORTR|nr:hypothetical protein [Portunus trituberculatus]